MSTLVYCTAYAETSATWTRRYRPWVDAVKRTGLADHILLVDDGSLTLPGWSDTTLSSGPDIAQAAAPESRGDVVLHHFQDRLGRPTLWNFPGWHRSFTFGAFYARRHGFSRVIHIESDAFLLSERILSFFRSYEEGWCALWCPTYGFPELAIQIVAGQGLGRFWQFAEAPYANLANRSHEGLVPFTEVERGFAGDRYGEAVDFETYNLDYVCQVSSELEGSYYGWRNAGARRATGPAGPRVHGLIVDFSGAGESASVIGEGWAQQEGMHRWMVGPFSTLTLPVFAADGPWVIRLRLRPHIRRDVLPVQRLAVVVNGRKLADFDVVSEGMVGVDVPAGILTGDGRDIIHLVHPDGTRPSTLDGQGGDSRPLALAVQLFYIFRPQNVVGVRADVARPVNALLEADASTS